MKQSYFSLVVGLVVCGALVARADYPVKPAAMRDVKVTGGFWLARLETNRLVTVKTDLDKCEETGRIDNFRKAARREKGTFKGVPFDDSDVFKVIEGAAYTLMTCPDPALEARVAEIVTAIAGAQEADGYLYTARTLGMEKIETFGRRGMMGPERWSATRGSHELYNMGHLIEAGVAWHEATGRRELLDVSIRVADLLDRTFGDGPGQIKRLPGHEEIELALCKLYRATGERRYLDLSQRFLSYRGHFPDPNAGGVQNHRPVLEQDEAVGHAVRAAYLYIGMADVAALGGNAAYRTAIERLWRDVVDTKLHLSGGIGAHHRVTLPGLGKMGEAFGAKYDLPNDHAYLETCAAIGNALWNERLFLGSGDGRYMDVIERIIYNGFLSGISISGDEFFYPNPLATEGGYKRSKWFGCSCCPVNVVRFIPQIPAMAYATEGNAAYVNLYLASEAKLRLASGDVKIVQRTDYPWSGHVELSVVPSAPSAAFALKVRLPGWATGRPVPSGLYAQTDPSSDGLALAVNGESLEAKGEKGYVTISRTWRAGDRVTLELPMPVKRIRADERVVQDRGQLAVERGPLVYCAEAIDNGGQLRLKTISPEARFTEAKTVIAATEMTQLSAEGMTLVPYFAWGHRGAGAMKVWMPTNRVSAICASGKAFDVEASHTYAGDSLGALTDGKTPASEPPTTRRHTFWDHRGTDEWYVLTLSGEETVKGVDVWWFDDESKGGNCRLPESWKVQVELGEMTGWKDVACETPVVKDGWSRAVFPKGEPAVRVRIKVKLRPKFSAGAWEIRVSTVR